MIQLMVHHQHHARVSQPRSILMRSLYQINHLDKFDNHKQQGVQSFNIYSTYQQISFIINTYFSMQSQQQGWKNFNLQTQSRQASKKKAQENSSNFESRQCPNIKQVISIRSHQNIAHQSLFFNNGPQQAPISGEVAQTEKNVQNIQSHEESKAISVKNINAQLNPLQREFKRFKEIMGQQANKTDHFSQSLDQSNDVLKDQSSESEAKKEWLKKLILWIDQSSISQELEKRNNKQLIRNIYPTISVILQESLKNNHEIEEIKQLIQLLRKTYQKFSRKIQFLSFEQRKSQHFFVHSQFITEQNQIIELQNKAIELKNNALEMQEKANKLYSNAIELQDRAIELQYISKIKKGELAEKKLRQSQLKNQQLIKKLTFSQQQRVQLRKRLSEYQLNHASSRISSQKNIERNSPLKQSQQKGSLRSQLQQNEPT